MIVKIFKQDEVVLIADIILLLTNLYVNEITYVQTEELPEELQLAFESQDEIDPEKQNEIQCMALEEWLKSRCLSNNDPLLDDKLKQIYHLPPQYSYGRLYEHQYLAGLLNYFQQDDDTYIVSPIQTETICFIYQDYRFPELWEIKPYFPS